MGLFKKVASVAAAPFTGGASLLALGDDKTKVAGASAMLPTMAAGMAANFGETWYNNYQSKKATKAQNEWNLAQWERENAYNHPKEIMKRYAEAGLNPNLIYGNAYESPAHLESAKQQAVPLDMMHNLLTMYNLDAQNSLLRAQAEEVRARKNLINTQNSNWTTDHTDWQRELVGFLHGLVGGRFGSTAGKYVRDAIFGGQGDEASQQEMSDINDLLFNPDESVPRFEQKHRMRKAFYKKYGRLPNY